MAILVGVVLLAAIAYYVSWPLMNARRGSGVGVDVASLEVQRDLVYDQIRELDMDHATGKTNDEDHQRIRAELVAQAAALLKQIDGVAQQPIAVSAPAVADDEIEALITARRKAKPATSLNQVKPISKQRSLPGARRQRLRRRSIGMLKRPSPRAAKCLHRRPARY